LSVAPHGAAVRDFPLDDRSGPGSPASQGRKEILPAAKVAGISAACAVPGQRRCTLAHAQMIASADRPTPSPMTPLNVIISGGFSGPYEKLLPQFERATGIRVATGSGSSQGCGPQTIGAQLSRGEPADVVILSREGLAGLIDAGYIEAGTDTDLARTPIGVAVRVGVERPGVGSVEALRQVLLGCRVVALPSSTSGIFLLEEVFPLLGIAEQIRVEVTPRGADAAALVVAGDADLALLPVSEIVHAPGVELAGEIAEEIQLHQVFSAAVVAGSRAREAALQLIAYLASENAADEIRRGGMVPIIARRPS